MQENEILYAENYISASSKMFKMSITIKEQGDTCSKYVLLQNLNRLLMGKWRREGR